MAISNVDLFSEGWRKRGAEMAAADWMKLGSQLIESLARALHRNIGINEAVDVSIGEGFSIDIRTTEQDPGVFDLHVLGTIGADVVGDRLLVRAWLFLYSNGLRIAPTGQEVFQLRLVPEDSGSWRNVGWGKGEHGEFDSYLRLTRS
jgi:hypothetical protein